MRSQRFHFNDSQVKKGSECSQRFHFGSSVLKKGSPQNQTCHLINSDKVKQCSEHWQRFTFNGNEL